MTRGQCLHIRFTVHYLTLFVWYQQCMTKFAIVINNQLCDTNTLHFFHFHLLYNTHFSRFHHTHVPTIHTDGLQKIKFNIILFFFNMYHDLVRSVTRLILRKVTEKRKKLFGLMILMWIYQQNTFYYQEKLKMLTVYS